MIVDQLGGARGKRRVLVAEEHGARQVVIERLRQRADHCAILDQTFDHEVRARLVHIGHAGMAELAIDIADARDGRAIVTFPAHQDDVSGAKRDVLALGAFVVVPIDECVVVLAAEPRERRHFAFGQLATRTCNLAHHVGHVAQDAGIAEAPAVSRRALPSNSAMRRSASVSNSRYMISGAFLATSSRLKSSKSAVAPWL